MPGYEPRRPAAAGRGAAGLRAGGVGVLRPAPSGNAGCADSPGRYLRRGRACHSQGAVSGAGSPDTGFVLRLRLHRPCHCQPGQGREGDAGRFEHGSPGGRQGKHRPEPSRRTGAVRSGGCHAESPGLSREIRHDCLQPALRYRGGDAGASPQRQGF